MAQPRATAFQSIVHATRQLNWSQFEGPAALRCTIGVAIVLCVGLVAGNPSISAFGAIGAVSVGFGSFQGTYRSRAAVMLWAALGMALAVFAGSITGSSDLAFIITVIGATFACGTLVALGPSASFVGLQCVVAVLVAGGFPADSATASTRAAIVLAGGVVQTLLVVMVWPLRRFSAERAALAKAYRSLAGYAAAIPVAGFAAPEPHTFATTASPLTDPHPFARAGEVLVFQALLDEAERIRASLAALTTQRPRMLDEHSRCADRLAQLSGRALDEIADALDQAREPRESTAIWEPLDHCARQLPHLLSVAAVLGQIRSAWQIASVMAPATDDQPPAGRFRPVRRRPPLRDDLTTLYANLSRQSAAFRHAVRLAATLGLCTTLSRVMHLDRGYWIAMTALLVLRPEFQDTFARGIARIAGTIAGALVATLIVWKWTPGPPALTVLVLVFVWGCYALVRINYAVFTACVTGYVVFILMLSGVGEMAAATTRVLYTIVGGAIALGAYGIWPTWSASGARLALAEMFDAHAGYVTALLSAFASPSSIDLAHLARMRVDGRLKRSNAEAIIERMLAEPSNRASIPPQVAVGLLAAFRRNALAALALHAGIEHGVPAVRGTARLTEQVATSLSSLGSAVRHATKPPPLPPMRQTQMALDAEAQDVIGEETNLLVDSINTMAELLIAERASLPP